MKKNSLLKVFIVCFLLTINKNFAQAPKLNATKNYIFTNDSIAGFEEVAAKNSAISEGFLGEEFKVRMFQLKRAYINAKYNLDPVKNSFLNTYNNKFTAITPACVNEDFEATPAGNITLNNQIVGWTIDKGNNTSPNNSCNLIGCCPSAPAEAQLISAPAGGYIDPIIGSGYPIFSVFGSVANTGNTINPLIPNMFGSNFLRLNSGMNDNSIEKASKTFVVTQSNALFQVAYIGVFSTGHTCCDAGAFQIKLTNVTANTLIACPGFSASGPSTQCSPTTTVNYFDVGTLAPSTTTSTLVFNKWRVTSMDLSAYIGLTIQVDIIASDCTTGGHYGYAYVDAQCSPLTVSLNGMPFPVVQANNFPFPPGPPSVTLSVCTATSAFSLTAPNGLGPYSWLGPQVGPPFTTPSMSNQTFTTFVNGTVTLVTNPEGGCGPTTTSVVVMYSTPYPTLPVTSSVCIGTSVDFVLSPINSYSLNNVATTSNTINVLPTASSIYTITASNSPTCVISNTTAVNVNTTCADVWPGDANSDGIADNLDILELGLHFTQTGPARTTTSNVWQSYFSNNWVGLITNGKNVNHSDCDGSGVIDLDDTLAVFNNYNSTHAFKENNLEIVNPQLTISPDQNSVQSGHWGTASVYLGDNTNPINNINGIAFKINFDQTNIQQDSAYLEYPVSFLNAGQNLNFRKNQFTSGQIYAATTHTNNINVNGNGKIAVFHFKVSPTLNSNTTFNFSVTQANQSNATGSINPLTVSSSSSIAIGKTVGIKENNSDNSIYIFPNPTNALVNIKSNTEIKRVELLNVTGQIILSENTKGTSHQLNLEAFAKGIYFVKIYNENGSATLKKLVTKD